MKRVPHKSTVDKHNQTIRTLFKYAIAENWVSPGDLLKLVNNGAKGAPRPDFDFDSWIALSQYMDEIKPHPVGRGEDKVIKDLPWTERGHNKKARMYRRLLRDYVHILVNTGIREGTESYSLKWTSLSCYESKGVKYLVITPTKGKISTKPTITRYQISEFF